MSRKLELPNKIYRNDSNCESLHTGEYVTSGVSTTAADFSAINTHTHTQHSSDINVSDQERNGLST